MSVSSSDQEREEDQISTTCNSDTNSSTFPSLPSPNANHVTMHTNSEHMPNAFNSGFCHLRTTRFTSPPNSPTIHSSSTAHSPTKQIQTYINVYNNNHSIPLQTNEISSNFEHKLSNLKKNLTKKYLFSLIKQIKHRREEITDVCTLYLTPNTKSKNSASEDEKYNTLIESAESDCSSDDTQINPIESEIESDSDISSEENVLKENINNGEFRNRSEIIFIFELFLCISDLLTFLCLVPWSISRCMQFWRKFCYRYFTHLILFFILIFVIFAMGKYHMNGGWFWDMFQTPEIMPDIQNEEYVQQPISDRLIGGVLHLRGISNIYENIHIADYDSESVRIQKRENKIQHLSGILFACISFFMLFFNRITEIGINC